MHSIANDIYIEDHYLGVTLGVIHQPRGLIQIDAPPSAEDSRAWRAALMGLSAGPERVLVNLDAHPDRTLGARAMDCTVLAHEKTAAVFRSRPTTFKAQGEETGSDWETIPGLGTIRWAPPEIAFSDHMALHWGETPVLFEHHPGPSAGAIWVILPEAEVIFIGDLVLKGQPPFLAHADLPSWVESIQALLSPDYKRFTLVSGRGGVVNANAVKAELEFIKRVRDRLEKLAARRQPAAATEKVAEKLATEFKGTAARHKQYAQRLRYGLRHYYARHYHAGSAAEE